MARLKPRTITSKSGRAVLLRSPQAQDAPAMMELIADHERTGGKYSVTQPDEREITLEKQEAFIREHLDKPGSVLILAEIGDRPVGSLNFRGNHLRRIAHHGTFGIGIHSEHREDGIGRAVIQALLDWATEHPVIEKVCLGVLANNPRAIHLYRSMGFHEDYRKPREFKIGPGEYIDDIQMSIWVKPG